MLSARNILLAVAAVFLLLSLVRLKRDGWRIGSAVRTWLLVSAIFVVVSLILAR